MPEKKRHFEVDWISFGQLSHQMPIVTIVIGIFFLHYIVIGICSHMFTILYTVIHSVIATVYVNVP